MTTTGFVINILNSMILQPDKNEKIFNDMGPDHELKGMVNIMMFKDEELAELVMYWIDNINEDYGQRYGGIGKYLDWACENVTMKYVNLYKKEKYEDSMELMKKQPIFNINVFWIEDTTLDIKEFSRLHYLIFKYANNK